MRARLIAWLRRTRAGLWIEERIIRWIFVGSEYDHNGAMDDWKRDIEQRRRQRLKCSEVERE